MSVMEFSVGFIIYILVVAFAFGAVFGSFLTCLADRLVRHESIVRGRSHCDHCGHVLGAADLVPIFSWLVLKGKCRYCGAHIPPRDVIVECMMGAVFAGGILRFGLGMEAVRWLALSLIHI